MTAVCPGLRAGATRGSRSRDDVSVVGILLAAGRGERFGGDKLLEPLGAGTVGATACRNLLAAVPEVLAVVRPGDAQLAAALADAGARIVECADADEGMGASLACGVRTASDAGGWVIALADMPWIDAGTIARVAAAVAGGAVVAAPFHRGRRGHPVGFGRDCAAALAVLRGDDGAKAVVAAHAAAMLRIDVDDAGVLRDVDTPNDLR
jgi:molybdenum cofactor cytidylyltransferase